jgi:UDP-glucose 4-epimerase
MTRDTTDENGTQTTSFHAVRGADAEAPGPLLVDSPELVLVSTGSRRPRFEREGIVRRKGEYALIAGHLTPNESMVEDLIAVREVLDAADIDFLLVRGDNDRPVLAVDIKRRKALERALSEAFAEEPFYSAPYVPAAKHDDALAADGRPVLVADGTLTDDSSHAIFRVYRPRIEPVGRLRYGPDTAFQLELWRFGDDVITAPTENALMRRTLPRAEAVEEEVIVYGRSWPTLESMFAELASDVTFDIDLVFSWVDGSAVEFQRQRAKRMKSYVVGDGDDSEARFRQIDELKYALRSVYMFAPWIRNIYIATDSPKPEWLDDHPRVTIMPSEAFFTDMDALPTHNSHAVESQLHKIPGIAEHFLYSNDDMFFGRPVQPNLFFSPGGITKFVEAKTRIGLGDSNPSRSGYENAARVNRRLLRERFGKVTTRHLEHCAAPLRRSVMQELEADFPEDFERTSHSQFRSATDISVTNSLYHYYALLRGSAVVQTNANVLYVETTLKSSLRQMKKLLKRRDQDMFCLNDGSKPEISVEKRTRAVTEFLERYFPVVAPWEKEYAASIANDASATAPTSA